MTKTKYQNQSLTQQQQLHEFIFQIANNKEIPEAKLPNFPSTFN